MLSVYIIEIVGKMVRYVRRDVQTWTLFLEFVTQKPGFTNFPNKKTWIYEFLFTI